MLWRTQKDIKQGSFKNQGKPIEGIFKSYHPGPGSLNFVCQSSPRMGSISATL